MCVCVCVYVCVALLEWRLTSPHSSCGYNLYYLLLINYVQYLHVGSRSLGWRSLSDVVSSGRRASLVKMGSGTVSLRRPGPKMPHLLRTRRAKARSGRRRTASFSSQQHRPHWTDRAQTHTSRHHVRFGQTLEHAAMPSTVYSRVYDGNDVSAAAVYHDSLSVWVVHLQQEAAGNPCALPDALVRRGAAALWIEEWQSNSEQTIWLMRTRAQVHSNRELGKPSYHISGAVPNVVSRDPKQPHGLTSEHQNHENQLRHLSQSKPVSVWTLTCWSSSTGWTGTSPLSACPPLTPLPQPDSQSVSQAFAHLNLFHPQPFKQSQISLRSWVRVRILCALHCVLLLCYSFVQYLQQLLQWEEWRISSRWRFTPASSLMSAKQRSLCD